MKRRILHGLVAIGVALATTLIPAAPAQASEIRYKVWFGYSGKCLEVGFFGYVQQWTCNGQKWYFDYMGEDLQHIPIWRIHGGGGWCLGNGVGHNNEAALSFVPCAPDRDESDKWQLLPVQGSTDYYRLRNRQNYLCATLFGGDAGRANGARIYQWDCNLGKIQYVGISL